MLPPSPSVAHLIKMQFVCGNACKARNVDYNCNPIAFTFFTAAWKNDPMCK